MTTHITVVGSNHKSSPIQLQSNLLPPLIPFHYSWPSSGWGTTRDDVWLVENSSGNDSLLYMSKGHTTDKLAPPRSTTPCLHRSANKESATEAQLQRPTRRRRRDTTFWRHPVPTSQPPHQVKWTERNLSISVGLLLLLLLLLPLLQLLAHMCTC